MLSDTIFQIIDDLLEGIVNYNYSSEYKVKLIHIIMKLNEIRDDLDMNGEGHILLMTNKAESRKIATRWFNQAVRKRNNSDIDFYD